MPTTRRQSAGPSTPSTSSLNPLSAKPSSSRSNRRSLSHTPSTHHRSADEIMLLEADHILHPSPPLHTPHHHRSADEIAAAEAESIVGTDSSPALRSGRVRGEGSKPRAELVVEIPVSRGMAKSRRAKERVMETEEEDSDSDLTEDKESQEVLDEEDTSAMLGSAATSEDILGRHDDDEEEEQKGKESTIGPGEQVIGREDVGMEGDIEAEGDKTKDLELALQASISEKSSSPEWPTSPESSNPGYLPGTTVTTLSQPPIVPETTESAHLADVTPIVQPTASTFESSSSTPSTVPPNQGQGDQSSYKDESSSDSDSDDDSSSASDTSESEDDSDNEAEEDARLERLLAAAKLSARTVASEKSDGMISISQGGEEDMLRLDADDQNVADAPIPQMQISGLPAPSLNFSKNGTAHAGPSRPSKLNTNQLSIHESSALKGKERAIELDDREYSRPLTKREKANQPKKATPSELWSTLPSARADMMPQMKRDYQALALANSMDPKRFMKGGNKAGKVPETFAIGTLVEPPRHLQDTTMTREQKYRPGQLVAGVVEDAGVSEYAKRKFGDLQWKRMENGRGKGWKKRTKW